MLKICRKTAVNPIPEQAAAKKTTKHLLKIVTIANQKHLHATMIAVLSVFHASLL